MKTNKAASYKHARIESEILNNLNHTLKNEIYDEELRLVCFSSIKLYQDRSQVIVYVDSYNDQKIDDYVRKLNELKGLFRTNLAKTMNLWKVPVVIFEKDLVIQKSLKIEKIIKEINEKK